MFDAIHSDDIDPPGAEQSTVAERVARHLKDGILAGRYAPGQRLIEADLTRDLGVSRGPLREAFRKLTAEGLIESVPNKGAVVRRLSQRETQELFDVRTALETLAARRAAENMRHADVRQRFEQAIAPIWNDTLRSSGLGYLDENRVFHQAIADASGNLQLAGLCRQMQLPLIMLQLSGMLTPETLRLSNQEHREIAQKVLAGDANAAASAIADHLDRARKFADTLPQGVFRGPDKTATVS